MKMQNTLKIIIKISISKIKKCKLKNVCSPGGKNQTKLENNKYNRKSQHIFLK